MHVWVLFTVHVSGHDLQRELQGCASGVKKCLGLYAYDLYKVTGMDSV